MTKENAHEYLPFVQALAEGKDVEFREYETKDWEVLNGYRFCSPPECYRIKPEKKLVPFTWDDRDLLMNKWIVNRLSDLSAMITLVYPSGVNHITYKELFEDYTFLDGTPCGKEVEE